MIFLSHNHADKPVVEPVAIRLAEIFGQDRVFYDSWSMRPGDGVIDKMNDGLTAPKFFFYFISARSLQSNMVKLEWQTALYKATKGECRIVPVLVDGMPPPPLLLQNVYINMHAHGVEAAILQIVNLIQGNSTFTPEHIGFSNLTYTVLGDPKVALEIEITASHLMEPNPFFAVRTTNNEEDVAVELCGGQPQVGGFTKGVTDSEGIVSNFIAFAPLGGAITPQSPMRVKLRALKEKPVSFLGLMHRVTSDQYKTIPMRNTLVVLPLRNIIQAAAVASGAMPKEKFWQAISSGDINIEFVRGANSTPSYEFMLTNHGNPH